MPAARRRSPSRSSRIPCRSAGVDVDWSALAPMLVLDRRRAAPARRRRALGRASRCAGVYALFTTVVAGRRHRRSPCRCGTGCRTPTGARSPRSARPSASTASRVFVTVVDLRRGHPRRPARRRLPAPRGARGPRALRPHAAVGVRRRDHGVGQRPHRDVPRPRDPLDRRLRAGRHAPAPDHRRRRRREVLRARRVLARRSSSTASPSSTAPPARRTSSTSPASSPPPSLADTGLLLAGLALLLVGFGFKVAAVPFHFWTPDVYQGAPSPSVACMASGVKVAGFAGLLRVFYLAFGTYRRRLAADRLRARRRSPWSSARCSPSCRPT